ncbi:hypothetical protein Bca4012_004236 [Brassica carinata]
MLTSCDHLEPWTPKENYHIIGQYVVGEGLVQNTRSKDQGKSNFSRISTPATTFELVDVCFLFEFHISLSSIVFHDLKKSSS